MQASGIYFAEEMYGYNKAQVDGYINHLTREYQNLHQEYEMAHRIIADARKAVEQMDGIMARLRQNVPV